mmetsp:Transcript_3879/g.9835  ORF Transcript_3879/g.9835 Transcript_3879/m.9835 type:complete len:158 (-) Transcript_3879:443-916(-)
MAHEELSWMTLSTGEHQLVFYTQTTIIHPTQATKFVTNFMQNVAAVSKQTWMSGQSNKATMAIMKYGTFTKPKNSPRDEVVTGLIMLPVFVIRAMPDCDQSHRLYGYTENTSNVETTFAKCAQEMIGVGTNQYNIHAVQGKMGVWVRPARFKHYRMI